MTAPNPNRYAAIIEAVFASLYEPSLRSFEFRREHLEDAAAELKIRLPNNVPDLLYSFRFRTDLPESITATQPDGFEWRIQLAGRGTYRFALRRVIRIEANPYLARTSVPDATPELIRFYALDDEQALLAIVRYNRLIDTFLGLTTYSLQNHLRTSVTSMGQIEIDELYVGIDRNGCHHIIPVQAKGGSDRLGAVQAEQDIAYVQERFDGIRCRAVSAQFLQGGVIALFELALQDDDVCIVAEKHYRLVPASAIDNGEIRRYSH